MSPQSYDEQLRPHREHLVEVPTEVTRRRLERYRLQEDVLQVVPLNPCFLKRLVATRVPEEFRPYVHPLDPVSLFDLKNWVGIDNEVAARQLRRGRISALYRDVPTYKLPSQENFSFDRLEPEQREVVHQVAHNLLYGYVEEDQLRRAPYAGVVNYMLERATKIPIFVAPDLIVCPDDFVEFKNFGVLYFNNIVVYGNGRIIPGYNTKVTAYHIKHVP